VVKKLERAALGLAGKSDTLEHLREELADVVTCAANLAWRAGIFDLFDTAIPEKFDYVSDVRGLPVKWKW